MSATKAQRRERIATAIFAAKIGVARTEQKAAASVEEANLLLAELDKAEEADSKKPPVS